MGSSNHSLELVLKKSVLSKKLQLLIYALLGLGVLSFALGFMTNPQRLWSSYLVSFFYFSSLGLGGLFFAAINHVSRAGWSVTIRRSAEAMTSFIPAVLVAGLVMLVGFKYLYIWADPAQVAENPVLQAKSGYLNVGFFVGRLVIFCAGWLFFKHKIVGNSLKQDSTGADELTHQNLGSSVAFILFFALSFSFFSVDLLMSLLPTWYSTIFGVYNFAGMFQSSMAVLVLLIMHLRNSGFVKGYITHEHQHDIVKYMKAFTIFWAYIAFSQFMLIWYANIPEETEYYIMRSQNGWLMVSIMLLIFRFIVPFLVLLPRGAKRDDKVVTMVSILVLVMQYVDIYWMVYPNFNDGVAQFGLLEIGVFAGFAGLFMFLVFNFFTKNSLVPVKDPRLNEALHHHVSY
jgi:hypothetical protein